MQNEYPSLSSAIRPVPHSAEIPVPIFCSLLMIWILMKNLMTAMMQILKLKMTQLVKDNQNELNEVV